MTDTRPHLEPGPSHAITIEPHPGRVTIRAGAVLVAETDRTVVLREGGYPPVLYIPVEDLNREALRPSKRRTYCPYKGEASYYDIVSGDGEVLDGAIWYYPQPYPAVSAISGRVAFYADRVTITEES